MRWTLKWGGSMGCVWAHFHWPEAYAKGWRPRRFDLNYLAIGESIRITLGEELVHTGDEF